MNTHARYILSTLLLFLAAVLGIAGNAFAQADAAPPAAVPPIVDKNAPLFTPIDKAAIIRLHGPVDDMMLQSIKRRIDIARKAGCTLVVYDLDTYGGLVQSALAITHLTRKLPTEGMHTVAWVNDKAYSAGAFIALSCEHIVMTSQGTLGDCAPIVLGWGGNLQPLPAPERAKLVSPLIEELDASANKGFGTVYDKALLHAMVVPDVEIHLMRNSLTGEERYVDTPGKQKLLDEAAPAPANPAGGNAAPVHPWQFVETVDTAEQLLTVSTTTALKMGLAQRTVDDENALRAVLNVRGNWLSLDFSWAENTTVWLTQWWVRTLLFVGMLIGAWIEFSHPGISVAGAAAVICLVLLVGAPFLTGLAQVWEIGVILLGLAIVVADLFALGGIGLLAIPGFLLMAFGLVASFVPSEPGNDGLLPRLPSSWADVQLGCGVIIGGCILALASFYLLSKYLHVTPGLRRLQLAPAGVGTAPTAAIPRRFTRTESAAVTASISRSNLDSVFVGAIGKTTTDLRPSGKATFGDDLVDVVSEGAFITRDLLIQITKVEGIRIVVKPYISPMLE